MGFCVGNGVLYGGDVLGMELGRGGVVSLYEKREVFEGGGDVVLVRDVDMDGAGLRGKGDRGKHVHSLRVS